MTRHAYPSSAMMGDYLRAAAGFVPTAAILALAHLGAVPTAIVGGMAALFLVFGIRTGLRHGTRIELSETGLTASGMLGVSIPWGELDRMNLAYYSTHRNRRARPGGMGFGVSLLSGLERVGSGAQSNTMDGWMQLRLRAGRSSLRLDSRIGGFAALVERSARAAGARGLELSAATAANLEALGIPVPALLAGDRAHRGGQADGDGPWAIS